MYSLVKVLIYNLSLAVSLEIEYNNNNSLINIWYGSYTAYTDHSVIEGKTCVFTGKKPL
jgi:hypothetical protein